MVLSNFGYGDFLTGFGDSFRLSFLKILVLFLFAKIFEHKLLHLIDSGEASIIFLSEPCMILRLGDSEALLGIKFY